MSSQHEWYRFSKGPLGFDNGWHLPTSWWHEINCRVPPTRRYGEGIPTISRRETTILPFYRISDFRTCICHFTFQLRNWSIGNFQARLNLISYSITYVSSFIYIDLFFLNLHLYLSKLVNSSGTTSLSSTRGLAAELVMLGSTRIEIVDRHCLTSHPWKFT